MVPSKTKLSRNCKESTLVKLHQYLFSKGNYITNLQEINDTKIFDFATAQIVRTINSTSKARCIF